MAKLMRRKWVDGKGRKHAVMSNFRKVKNWQKVSQKKVNYTPYIIWGISVMMAIVLILLAVVDRSTDGKTEVTDDDGDKQMCNPEYYNDGRFTWSVNIDFLKGGLTGRNESKDRDCAVSALDEDVEPLAHYRQYPEISAIDYIVFAILAMLVPSGMYGKVVATRRNNIEKKFPDFLRDLAEFWKGGLSMTVAVETLAKGEYGHLNEEVNKMATQISWGVSFEEVLHMLRERVESQLVDQAISMVSEANKAGGRISDILLAASFDAKEIKALQVEREINIGSYVAVIYTSFGVYLIIVLILVFTFVPAIADSSASQDTESGGIGNMKVKEIDPIWVATIFFWSIVIQSTGGGMVAGFMKTGQMYGGLNNAALLLFVSWWVYEVLGIQTSMFSYIG